MTHTVIARKYRPQRFEDVVGQQAVVQTLKNAITSSRIHHAYLFCGARGVGKTTLARLFAKALNCELGPTPTPCETCAICQQITSGNALDVLEMDGASHTSVDDVREIREQLKYLPAAARYKIILIDEVHMLSTSAFNALLKTLEEPPAHVVFLFATTESHKIPATVLSRCQRFDLRRIAQASIAEQLEKICIAEQIHFDPDALKLIAREGAGSLRDAESLLDQSIALGAGTVGLESTQQMLGLTDQYWVSALSEAVLSRQSKSALELTREFFLRGHDLRQFMTQWLEFWRHLLVWRESENWGLLPELTDAERQSVEKLAPLLPLHLLDLGFYLIYESAEKMARSESGQLLFEVLVIRLIHLAELVPMDAVLEALGKKQADVSKAETSKTEQAIPTSSLASPVFTKPREPVSSRVPVSTPAPSPTLSAAPASKTFLDFLRFVQEEKPQLASLLSHAATHKLEGETLELGFEPQSSWAGFLKDRQDQLEGLTQQFFGRPCAIKIVESLVSEKRQSPANPDSETISEKIAPLKPLDPIIQSAVKILSAKIEEVKS